MSNNAYLKGLYPFLDELRVLQAVQVLGKSLDHLEALQNIYYIVYAPPLDAQRLQTVFQVDGPLFFSGTEEVEELEAKLAKGFLCS